MLDRLFCAIKNCRRISSRQQNWLYKTSAERHASMTWTQRLKRDFSINIETCELCAGQVKIIVCIEDPPAIERILAHLKSKAPCAELAVGRHRPYSSIELEKAPINYITALSGAAGILLA